MKFPDQPPLQKMKRGALTRSVVVILAEGTRRSARQSRVW
jgi:hypothetical protein